MRTTVKSIITTTALAIAGLAAIACEQDREPLGPEGDGPFGATGAAATTAGGTRVTGLGAIGFSLAVPGGDRQEFDFDATDTPGGRLAYRDFSVVRSDGSVASLTADPAVHAATGISSFTQTSAACVTFGGIARVDTGELVDFSVDACDNGSPGAGVDFFGISVPVFTYSRSGTLTEGEITLSGGTTPTTGDLEVTTATTGSDLDPDGYTVTVDGTTSQAIGTNATVHFGALAEGSHTVELSGVSANCTVSGETPRTVTVVAGSVVSTTFDVTCTATTTTGVRITGQGAIGSGMAIPLSDRQEFDFDVTNTPGGRLFYRDWSFVREDLTVVSGATITADPMVDPATGVSSFTQTSAACVAFGGRGVTDRGAYLYFSVDACDNGSPGVGVDTFAIRLYEVDFEYSRSGTLTAGEITLSTF